jgi:hypothetical protein
MAPSRVAVFGAALLLLGFGLALAARAALGVERGLRAEYFASLDPGGTPVRTAISRSVSTAQVAADWNGTPPAAFRGRWFGFLAVLRAGDFTFATRSAGRSSVTIDDMLVVDNGGSDPRAEVAGRISLDRGLHLVVVDLAASGTADIAWLWARDEGLLTPVPAWVLSADRVPLWRVAASRATDWVPVAVALLLATLAAMHAWRSGAAGARLARHPHAASLAFFVLLAIVQTWPLASDPGHWSRNDNGDTLLNEWAIAWVAHQAPRAPLELFDGNIFHPERYTLAYSEAMIVQSTMAAPLLWLGATPVLAYNLVLIAGFALTGWAGCLVAARWTGSWTAGVLTGILFGINAHTLTRLPHLQAQHVEFLPLALLSLDRLLAEPRMGHALRLSGWFVLQALTSVYLLVFAAFGLLAAALARPENWWGRRLWPFIRRGLVAAAVASALLAPFLIPYWLAHAEQGMTRSLVDAEMYSAGLADYLSTPARLHYAWWSHRFFPGSTALFPGFGGLALAIVSVLSGVAFRDRRARMFLAIGVCGVLFSLGIRLPGYSWLWEHLPLLQAIRAPVRFGYLAIVAVAFLAGFGLLALKRWLPPRAWAAAAGVALLLAVAEPFTAPMYLTPFGGIPAIYARLAGEPDAVVIEMPFWREGHRHAPYMLNATAHWKPLVNGYSGFAPESFYDNRERLAGFPDAAAMEGLKAIGVTHVFVHGESYPPEALAAIARTPGLQKVDENGTITLYRLQASDF